MLRKKSSTGPKHTLEAFEHVDVWKRKRYRICYMVIANAFLSKKLLDSLQLRSGSGRGMNRLDGYELAFGRDIDPTHQLAILQNEGGNKATIAHISELSIGERHEDSQQDETLLIGLLMRSGLIFVKKDMSLSTDITTKDAAND